ncbi:hypothetical protein BC831DRAFT_446252 [Entophlyctis helioformis]|nr:hypothetical protein BC831DRAFT_446252 [Entophlyctis helioformis]
MDAHFLSTNAHSQFVSDGATTDSRETAWTTINHGSQTDRQSSQQHSARSQGSSKQQQQHNVPQVYRLRLRTSQVAKQSQSVSQSSEWDPSSEAESTPSTTAFRQSGSAFSRGTTERRYSLLSNERRSTSSSSNRDSLPSSPSSEGPTPFQSPRQSTIRRLVNRTPSGRSVQSNPQARIYDSKELNLSMTLSRDDLRNALEAFTSDAVAKQVEQGYDPVAAVRQPTIVVSDDNAERLPASKMSSMLEGLYPLKDTTHIMRQSDEISTLSAFGVIETKGYLLDNRGSVVTISGTSSTPAVDAAVGGLATISGAPGTAGRVTGNGWTSGAGAASSGAASQAANANMGSPSSSSGAVSDSIGAMDGLANARRTSTSTQGSDGAGRRRWSLPASEFLAKTSTQGPSCDQGSLDTTGGSITSVTHTQTATSSFLMSPPTSHVQSIHSQPNTTHTSRSSVNSRQTTTRRSINRMRLANMSSSGDSFRSLSGFAGSANSTSLAHVRGILKNSVTATSSSIASPAEQMDPGLVIDFGGQVQMNAMPMLEQRHPMYSSLASSMNRGSQASVPAGGILSSQDSISQYASAVASTGTSLESRGSAHQQTPFQSLDRPSDSIAQELGRELPEMERRLMQRMRPAVYFVGEFIIRKHDIGKQMYFLSKGKVEVVSGDGKVQYSIINRGSFFGELGDLDDVMKDFPAISERFQQVVASRMEEVNQKRATARRAKVNFAGPAAMQRVTEEEEFLSGRKTKQ